MQTPLKPSKCLYSEFNVQMKNRQKRYRYKKNWIRRMEAGEKVPERLFIRAQSCTPSLIQDEKVEKMYLAKDLEMHNLAITLINESYVNRDTEKDTCGVS